MADTAIKAENLCFSYSDAGNASYESSGITVFSGISFEIRYGEAVGLIGANGTGKSTLMKMLVGLLPHEGKLSVGGASLDGKYYKKNLSDVRRVAGYLMQDSDNQLFMPTVYDDVTFGPKNSGLGADEVELRVSMALEKTGISHLRDRQNMKLSGGEKRLAALAAVLAMEPSILLLDEPSNALDPYNRRNLINILNGLEGTKLIASHDLDLILDTCERVILLKDGEIASDGPAMEILRDKSLLEGSRLELPFRYQI